MTAEENIDKFRSSEVKRICQYFLNEIELRSSKRYKNIRTVCDMVYIGSTALSLASGLCGMGMSATMAESSAAFALEAVFLGSASLSIGADVLCQSFAEKIEKHKKRCLLARSKLKNINDIMNRTSPDSYVSDNDYNAVVNEYNTYLELPREHMSSRVEHMESTSEL